MAMGEAHGSGIYMTSTCERFGASDPAKTSAKIVPIPIAIDMDDDGVVTEV